jgi:hypothetical protein
MFDDWASVPRVADFDHRPAVAGGVDLTEVALDAEGHALFVYARAHGAFFDGPLESIVRIFVDADANRSTGFDLGDSGADLMLEVAGSDGSTSIAQLFVFASGRDASDWNGWVAGPAGVVAVRGESLEAAFGGLDAPSEAVVSVALSRRGAGEDLMDVPTTAAGVLLVHQRPAAPSVLAAGQLDAPLLHLTLAAWGRSGGVSTVSFAPSGGADFGVVAGARLYLPGERVVAASSVTSSQIQFQLEPPVDAVSAGVSAELRVDLRAGEAFGLQAGRSAGARVDEVSGPASQGFQVLRPHEPRPSAYLGYVSPMPVIDGAFGEWRLAGGLPDGLDPSTDAGLDLLGVGAMWTPGGSAFFAEMRGAALAGASLFDFGVHQPAPMPARVAPNAAPAPPSVPPDLPPISADDELLVYIDSDRQPTTGFQVAPDIPVGAEYVIQVAGRFSEVKSAHLLAFSGDAPWVSAWRPIAPLLAVADGTAVEGAIPEVALAGGGAARILFQTVAWSGRTADVADGLQEIEAGPPSPDRYLHFRSVVFDPLSGPPPVRPALLLDEPNGYWVVQLTQPPTTAMLGALEGAGASLFGYVHSNAYLAKMDSAQARSVGSMPGVRWVGIYQPAFKFPSDPSRWIGDPVVVQAILFEPNPSLPDQVAGVGGELISSTERSLRVRINTSNVERLGGIAAIQYVEPENRRVPLNDVGRRLQGVNLTYERLGLDGAGIVVGIGDSGLDFTHPAFDDTGNATSGPHFDGRIVGYYRYGDAYGDSDGHGTHTAGSIAGDGDLSSTVNQTTPGGAYQFRGVAPAASLVVSEIFAPALPSDDQVFADQEAYGATVSSNSWGYVDNMNNPITDYDASAYVTDQSVIDANTSKAGLQPMTIVFAVGNDGSGADTVGSPSTAKNVITVGASESDRGYDAYADNPFTVATFSSRGPTDDGRIKPDVVAVGTYVLSTQSRTAGCTCTYGGWDMAWTGPHYAFSSGTSQATPQVSGMVALIQQHINDTYGQVPSPALVKAALINGAEDLGYGYEFTTGVTGPMTQGWGRVNVSRSTEGPPNGGILLYDEGPTVASGEVVVRRVAVANASTPLKVTLVWTDMPGNPADTKALAELMNDLDLVVRAPNGTAYHGNKFGGAWSRPNNTTFDRLNNVENVFVQAPAAGTWTVEVSGYSIKSAKQRFALAVSGNASQKGPPAVAASQGVPGAPAGARFGWNVTAGGSINGDAYADVVVGAPGTNGGSGSVYIFFGGPMANFSNFNVSRANVTLAGSGAESFGWSMDSSGDFNGDGKADLLVGAPAGGKAYLFLGGVNWTSRTANVTFNGSAADRFGAAVRLVPLLDNATGAEAAVGAPARNGSRGAVYLFSGGTAVGVWSAGSANATLQGNASNWTLGAALSAGDLDADGHMELAVGAPGACLVRIVRGGVGPSALAFNATITGIPGTAFGNSLALESDLNGDGKDDVVVGAPMANQSAGAAYIFFGASPIVDNRVLRSYFFDDLEDGVGQWNEMSGETVAASPWSLSNTADVGDAGQGHAWQDSSGPYAIREDASIAFKDAINLSTATSPLLSFAYRADLEDVATNYDGFLVKYSLNNGSSWSQLDASNLQGLYDTTAYRANKPSDRTPIADLWAFTYDRFVWRQVTFNLSSLVGNASVKIRFQFASDLGVNADGIYLDNIAVREANPSSPNATYYGDAAGDLFGWSVVALPGANFDAYGDFAVGAPGADAGLVPDAGAVYVFTGNASLPGTTFGMDSAEITQGGSGSDQLGYSLSSLSGFNDSASTYFFAGAPGAGDGSGSGTVADASTAIPEFADAAAVALILLPAAMLVRRRAPTPSRGPPRRP